ncbi:hypothetical protein SOVF_112970 [Spinacia oleracea]|uniref:Activator of Hsp90 ATPase AHSA1-like N-terminal domain-containing protein n=1 Tax=Spinacia oleracea TaxID=3562 RepID=A0A9R0JAU0_SPIOL|nr:uncharacterized protein LOC110803213 [Spinacia oleracea]KNA13850.1 hypothetical protein SOVF_112970 [Spinacia oleracea]
MEGEAVSEKQTSSYTYWVRESTSEAVPLPVPKMLSAQDVSNQTSHAPTLGSVWNTAGTWEEKNLNRWATERIKELLGSVGSLEFTNGKAELAEVSKCSGDAYLVTVRNKKRVCYTYELTIDVKGEWLVGGENKKVKGYLEIAEFSYGELDDLEVTVNINGGSDMPHKEKYSITQDLKSFLQPLREKLLQFEQELKER